MTGCPAASGLVMTTVAAAAATAAPPAVTGANAEGSSERCNWAFTGAGKGESMVQDQAGTPRHGGDGFVPGRLALAGQCRTGAR